MSEYLLKMHEVYHKRVLALKERVQKLKKKLPREEFLQHKDVKFAYRLRKATLDIIPQDPNKPEYRLKGELKKFRRYKQGLQRYRLFFAFSNSPEIIVYLYINDESSLRSDGEKNDPYRIFLQKKKKGIFSHDPKDPKMQKWLREMCKST